MTRAPKVLTVAVVALSLLAHAAPTAVGQPAGPWTAPAAPPAEPVPPRSESAPIRGVDRGSLAEAPPLPGHAPERARRKQPSTAGAERELRDLPFEPGEPEVLTGTVEAGRFRVAGVTWQGTAISPEELLVHVRLREGRGWSDWERLEVMDVQLDEDAVASGEVRQGTEPLFTDGADAAQVRVDTPHGEVPPGLQIATIEPGTSPRDAALQGTPMLTEKSAPLREGLHPEESAESGSAIGAGEDAAEDAAFEDGRGEAAAPAPTASHAVYTAGTATTATATTHGTGPTIITRAEWGADESIRTNLLGTNTTVKSVVIHHTAGSNSYSRDTAAQQMRGIYAYHAKTLGWGDIGYHFVVDQFGRIYEGRHGSLTASPKGAHTAGNNVDTMGVSAMGNYDVTAPPQVMVDAIGHVTGWKLSQYGRNPQGTVTQSVGGVSGSKYNPRQRVTLPTVNAHRDTYQTACPGRYLYPLMGQIRDAAAWHAANDPALPAGDALYAEYGDTVRSHGDRGLAVRALQNALNNWGFPVGTVDGVWGPMTNDGLRSFQASRGLPQDGDVDRGDWRLLAGLPPAGQLMYDRYGGTTLSSGARGQAVRALQYTLNDGGFGAGAPDGSFGPATAGALRRFQDAKGLVQDVAVHHNDWRALSGIGYTPSAPVARLWGSDRYGAAAAVSEAYAPGVEVAYVANGRKFAGAMTASAPAGRDDAPVLLVRPGGVPGDTVRELERLRPRRIVIVGGPRSVSDGVRSQLRRYATSGQVTRWWGDDRYSTAAEVASRYPSGANIAYIVNGQKFPGAMTAAAPAGRDNGPVLLVKPGEVPAATRDALQQLRPERIVVVGGPKSVHETTREQLERYSGGGVVGRWDGHNRYSTAARVSRTYPTSTDVVYVANGTKFPGAMTASAPAGKENSPLLLVRPDAVPDATREALERLSPRRIVLVGGPEAVSAETARELRKHVP